VKCTNVDAEFEARTKERQLEVQAVTKALEFLTSDEAHDLFSRTLGFVQKAMSSKRMSSKRLVASRILAAARSQDPRISNLQLILRNLYGYPLLLAVLTLVALGTVVAGYGLLRLHCEMGDGVLQRSSPGCVLRLPAVSRGKRAQMRRLSPLGAGDIVTLDTDTDQFTSVPTGNPATEYPGYGYSTVVADKVYMAPYGYNALGPSPSYPLGSADHLNMGVMDVTSNTFMTISLTNNGNVFTTTANTGSGVWSGAASVDCIVVFAPDAGKGPTPTTVVGVLDMTR